MSSDTQLGLQCGDHLLILLVRQVYRLRVGDGKSSAELKAALILGDDMEMQMGIRVAEGAQVQLRAAPQLLDGAAGLSQILGKIRPLLIRALSQLFFVGLQSQRTAALVGLILEEIQHTGLHLPNLEHNGLPALVVLIAIETTHWHFLLSKSGTVPC